MVPLLPASSKNRAWVELVELVSFFEPGLSTCTTMPPAAWTWLFVGASEGNIEGKSVGTDEGSAEGTALGPSEGAEEGGEEGIEDGEAEGTELGLLEG